MEWIETQWRRPGELGKHGIQIDLIVSPFYEGEKYAVRNSGYCLNKKGSWEAEPLPSSRTDAFYKRCRFDTLEDAAKAADAKIAKEAK